MDTNEILAALRAMREEYAPSPTDGRNYPGMESDELARHMAADDGVENIRAEVRGDLDRIINQIWGDRPVAAG